MWRLVYNKSTILNKRKPVEDKLGEGWFIQAADYKSNPIHT